MPSVKTLPPKIFRNFNPYFFRYKSVLIGTTYNSILSAILIPSYSMHDFNATLLPITFETKKWRIVFKDSGDDASEETIDGILSVAWLGYPTKKFQVRC